MRILRKSVAIVLIYALLLASLPLHALAAAPVATSFSVTASTVGNKPITLQGSDADGTSLTFAILSNPSHGAISNFNASTGALIYTPAFGYTGADSFTFRVTSGGQDSNTATVSITVAADKTRVIDYVTDAGGVGQRGTVTFILTTTATSGGGLISPASSVSAVTDATGKYDLSIIPSANLNPKTYYQVYFQTNYSDRRLLGVYDIPVSATPIVLQSYKVTDTNLAARYTFADKASVDSLQTANANAVFQSLLPTGIEDGRVIGYDSGTGRMRASAIRETSNRVEFSKPLGNVTADNISAANVTVTSITGNGAGLTGIAGATGGVNNTGSTTVGADSDANGIGVIDETVGNVTIKRTHADRVQLMKPLELPSATKAGIASLPNETIARATDGNKGLYINKSGRAVALDGGLFNVQVFGAIPGDGVDDVAAFVATANAAGSGGTIDIPEGDYNFASSFSLPYDKLTVQGRGKATKITYTGSGIAISVNGKQFCLLTRFDLVTSTGTIGIDFPILSHNSKVELVDVAGFSTAGIKFVSTFYSTVDRCDIYNNQIGVDLNAEANEVRVTNNNIRQNIIGVRIFDGAGASPNGNKISGNGIESARVGVIAGVQLLGADSNMVVDNRLEIVGSAYHIGVKLGSGHVSQFNQLHGNVMLGTAEAYDIGDASGVQQANNTHIIGGRGGIIRIRANAHLTRIDALPGSFSLPQDDGSSSIVQIDPASNLWYMKNGSGKKYNLVVGGVASEIDSGANYLDIKGAVGVHSRFEATGRLRVAQGSLTVSGDSGGFAGGVTLSNQENTGTARSTGVGAIKFADGTSRDCVGFIKVYLGTTAYYLPVFAAN